MTISKYEQTLADQSRHIIESDKTMKPILDKIEDLDRLHVGQLRSLVMLCIRHSCSTDQHLALWLSRSLSLKYLLIACIFSDIIVYTQSFQSYPKQKKAII